MFESAQETIKVSWINEELAKADFGDARLDVRLIQIASEFFENPQAAIHAACRGKAEAKAAYRFFANDKVKCDSILKLHVGRTLERCLEYGRVFAIEDTSTFNYGTHKSCEGLGAIAGGKGLEKFTGLIMHSTLAVSPDGIPLGLLDQLIWAREDGDHAPRASNKEVIMSLESEKWERSWRVVQELFKQHSVEVVVIADREGDIAGWIEKMVEEKTSFVIRARSKGRSVKDVITRKLTDAIKRWPSVFAYDIDVAVKSSKHASRRLSTRRAKVEVSYQETKLFDQYGRSKIPVHIVAVREPHPPKGMAAVEWALITSVPVNSPETALEIINWYRQRWHIENFHRVLKSGCTVESARLGDEERLEKYITLMSVIAWRLYWMDYIARAHPAHPCDEVLSADEWNALCTYRRYKNIKPLPPKDRPPTVREAVHWIAGLGGFLGRKGDREPGVITFWRGYRRLMDLTMGYIMANASAACG